MTTSSLSSSIIQRPSVNLNRVTVEHLAYAALVVLGVAVRGLFLGGRPLAPEEAATALRAWQASQGLGPQLDQGIPLLFTLQTTTFFLAGASNALARLWPLLAAALLPVAIYAWRDWVGRTTALLAAALVTMSPLLNAFARRGDGATLVMLALAVALAGWSRLQSGRAGGWTLVAVGSALALIGGPAAPTALIGLGLVLLISRHGAKLGPIPQTSDLVAFFVTLLLGGTVFLTHVQGLGLAALNWTTWWQAFELKGQALLWGAIRLLFDEPLLLPLGLAGLISAFRERQAAWALGLAGLAAMIVAWLQGPYAADSRAIMALLLAVPAASFGRWLARAGAFDRDNIEAWIYAVLLAVLSIVALLSLISYANAPGYSNRTGLADQLVLMLGAIVIAIVLTVLMLVYMGRKPALSMAALVIVFGLGMFNLATAWGLGYDTALPRFPALYALDARPAVDDLARDVAAIGERQNGQRWSLPVTIVTGSPADDLLAWQLRPDRGLRLANSVALDSAPPLIVTPVETELALGDRYLGRDYAILDAWDPAQGDRRQKILWLLYRQAPYNLPTQNSILWADAQTLTQTTVGH